MKVNNVEDLNAAINSLERKQVLDKEMIVENFHEFKSSITPKNLAKESFNRVKDSPGLTDKIIKSGVGLGVGILAKRFVIGRSTGFVSSLIGTAVKVGVMGLVAKNSVAIRRNGVRFLKAAFGSKRRY